MTNCIDKEEKLPPRWLIEEQLTQQKEDAKYLVKYNKKLKKLFNDKSLNILFIEFSQILKYLFKYSFS